MFALLCPQRGAQLIVVDGGFDVAGRETEHSQELRGRSGQFLEKRYL